MIVRSRYRCVKYNTYTKRNKRIDFFFISQNISNNSIIYIVLLSRSDISTVHVMKTNDYSISNKK